MNVYTYMQILRSPEEGVRYPGLGVTGSCEIPDAELYSCLLKDPQVLFTVESSLQPYPAPRLTFFSWKTSVILCRDKGIKDKQHILPLNFNRQYLLVLEGHPFPKMAEVVQS